ncbi:sigma-70 family RNA polymerase sigma factor [Desulfocurvibacter africanus]|uniref:sigma-70 family RNA polymerase sigma factor n=1 Tax=Desulfocurvibacter africanus TaxID=873 RepID=UPI0004125A5D|nr:RNA polymerase factor sigma-32 [Desulfocurvibacter africanus]
MKISRQKSPALDAPSQERRKNRRAKTAGELGDRSGAERLKPEDTDEDSPDTELTGEDETDTPEMELEAEPDLDDLVEELAPEGMDQDEVKEPGETSLGPGAFRLPVLKAGRGGTADILHMYMQEISRFPILKPEEEVELARRVRDTGDQDAAFRLVTSHLRLVVKIAMDFQRRWMQNVLDLVQEGNVGLMRAVQKFDPEKGIKFSYYAAFWIKAYILKFIMDNWRMVKIGTTQTQRKLFYNLNKERQRLQSQGFDPTSSTLSKSLGVSVEDIEEMDQRLSRSDMSLDITIGDDTTATRMDFLPALGPGIEETLANSEISALLREHLASIVPMLSDKEQDILQKRLLSDSPVTLREIGDQYGITRERVRQIEARLLQKIREHLTDKIEDFSKDWIRENE